MKIRVLMILAVVLSLVAGAADAQTRGRGGGGGSGEGDRGDALPLGAYLNERLTTLDQELAAAVIQRAQVPPDRIAVADLEIDLRILQRWVWEQMAKAGSADLQAMLYARGLALEQAVADMRPFLAVRASMPPTRTQAEAMVRLHQLTFTLEDVKDAAQLDAVMQRAAASMLDAVAENPVDFSTIPAMRPKSRQRNATTQPTNRAARDDRPPSLEQLAEQAQVMTVSPPLRVQLVAVARAAIQASHDAKLQQEAERLQKLLIDGMELAEGLAANTAVSAEERMALEHQLTAALALSADRRLRAAGDARMAALRPYRQTLARVGRLRLTAEERGRLNNALAYAQANPDSADAIFSAIEQRRELEQRFGALPPEPPPDAQVRRAIDELRRQFAQSIEQFYETAGNLGAGGIFATTPDELTAELGRMRRQLELLDLLYRLPLQVQALAQYKPRPASGLERRMGTAALGASVAVASAQRDGHEKALRAIAELAQLAADLSARPLSSLPADEAQPFTGGAAQAFDNKWKALVQELASAVARGDDLDPARLDLLRRHQQVVDVIVEAIELSKGQVNWDALSRWADWTMRADDFEALLTPIRQELSGAVQALASGQAYDFRDFQRRRDRYAPVIAFVRKANAYAEQLQGLPTGITGSCGKLLTPMANQPFATERFAGLATRLWMYQDAQNSDQILRDLARRLAPEVGMRYREDRRR